MKRKIVIILVIVLVVASVLANGYFVGWKKIEQKIYMRGVNDVVGSIILQVQQTGEVRINTNDGQIILVPK